MKRMVLEQSSSGMRLMMTTVSGVAISLCIYGRLQRDTCSAERMEQAAL